MNIRLYYPSSIVENTTALVSKEHTHYIMNVLRLKRGSNINFFNKTGEWKSEIVFLEKDRIEVKFLEKIKSTNKLSKIELAAARRILACGVVPSSSSKVINLLAA